MIEVKTKTITKKVKGVEKEVEPSAEEKDDKPSEVTGGPGEAAAQFFKEKEAAKK